MVIFLIQFNKNGGKRIGERSFNCCKSLGHGGWEVGSSRGKESEEGGFMLVRDRRRLALKNREEEDWEDQKRIPITALIP